MTREVITSIRMGRATGAKKVKRAVQMIVDQVLNNETSIVGLTTIRDYDEYTFTHSVNVCIFSVALGKKLSLSRLQLYDRAGHELHAIGEPGAYWEPTLSPDGRRLAARIDPRSRPDLRPPGLARSPLAIIVAREQQKAGHRISTPDPSQTVGILFLLAYDGSMPRPRRVYQSVPWEADAVLRDMWFNPGRGYDPTLVKALINLLGIYPVGTCVILDTLEVAIVYAPNPDATLLNRPLVRIAIDVNGGAVPPPGTLVNLAEQDGPGHYVRSIVKVTNPSRYGLTVGN